MARFDYSNRAEEDLFEIVLYIALDNVVAAEKVNKAIEETAQALAENPEIGRSIDSVLPDLQVFPASRFPHYLFFCQQRNNGIYIQRIFRGARDITSLLKE